MKLSYIIFFNFIISIVAINSLQAQEVKKPNIIFIVLTRR